MPDKKTLKKSFFKPIHLFTLLFLIFYFGFLNVVFLSFVANSNIYIYTFGPFIFNELIALTFLYLFSHKNYFLFMGVLEKGQKSKEGDYIEKYLKYGKFIACVIISWVGGPMFLALTARFLFPATSNRYLVVFMATLLSTLFGIAVAKGLLSFL